MGSSVTDADYGILFNQQCPLLARLLEKDSFLPNHILPHKCVHIIYNMWKNKPWNPDLLALFFVLCSKYV